MFSGGDSSGDGLNSLNQFGNFCLPSQTLSGSIDWASLAQQWIQMKDNTNSNLPSSTLILPNPPPPPTISTHHSTTAKINKYQPLSVKKPTSNYEEKGEADMDMDDGNESDNIMQLCDMSNSPPPPPPSMRIEQNSSPIMQSQKQQQEWFIQQRPSPVSLNEIDVASQPQITLNNSAFSTWPPRVPPPPILPISNANPTAHIPSLLKINVPNPHNIKPVPDQTITTEINLNIPGPCTVDVAKRKILPAWIREGLEKMEREKQKQLEKDQHFTKDLDVNSAESKWESEITNETVKDLAKETLESDSSGNEDDSHSVNRKYMEKGEASLVSSKTNTLSNSKANHKSEDSDDSVVDVPVTGDEQRNYGKNYERKLSDLMIVVRRTITELLLEVTNAEISSIAQEAIKVRQSKASSAQVIRKSALSSITGKLGLAAYNSSSDENSDTENEQQPTDNENNEIDSEEEIRATIRTKRRAFAKVSEQIEERLTDSAIREEEKLKYYANKDESQENLKEAKSDAKRNLKEKLKYREHESIEFTNKKHYSGNVNSSSSGGKGYEREFGETSESKLQHSNGNRFRERTIRKERTTRFSDNKDSKNIPISLTNVYLPQLSGNANIPSHISSISSTHMMPRTSNSTKCTTAIVSPLDNTTGSFTDKTNQSETNAYSNLKLSQTNINNALCAAEAVIKKAIRVKSDNEKRRRKNTSTSSSSSNSSESNDDSDSNSSKNSKCSRSLTKQKKKINKELKHHSSAYRKKSNHERDRYTRDSGRSSHSQKYSRRHRSSGSEGYSGDDHYKSRRSNKTNKYNSKSQSQSRSRSRSRSRSSYGSKTNKRSRH